MLLDQLQQLRTEGAEVSVGDAGIQTSPGELVRWADNYRIGRVGGPALLGAILTDAAETTDPGYRYGAGIITSPDGSLTHHGQLLGFETSFWPPSLLVTQSAMQSPKWL